MEDFNELKAQSRWSGKRVVLLYWMALLFFGTGVAVGLGTSVFNPQYSFTPRFDHSTLAAPHDSSDCDGCHSSQYDAWNMTQHASMTTNGTHVFPNPFYGIESGYFNSSCAHCMTTGYANNSGIITFTEYGIGCVACHESTSRNPGGYLVNDSAALCGACHTGSGHPTYDGFVLGTHPDSLSDLLGSSHSGDDCLHCMAGQAPYADANDIDLWLNNTALTGITCATCHDPHSQTYGDTQLRNASINELCGTCHGSSERHSEYEQMTFPGGDHATLDCTDCHGYDLVYGDSDHDDIPDEPGLNHSWAMDLPYTCNQSGCHTDDPDTYLNIELVQADVEAALLEYETLYNATMDKITTANGSSDVTDAQVAEAMALVEEAEGLIDYVHYDASGGFHNKAWAMDKISNAKAKLNSAQTALEPVSEDDDSPGFAGLVSILGILSLVAFYLKKRR